MIEHESFHHPYYTIVSQGRAADLDTIRELPMFDYISSFEQVCELIRQRILSAVM